MTIFGCETYLIETSVTPLIARVDSVSLSSLTAPCVSLQKIYAWSQRTTFPNRAGPFFSQWYTSSCASLLDPPNKFSRSFCRKTG